MKDLQALKAEAEALEERTVRSHVESLESGIVDAYLEGAAQASVTVDVHSGEQLQVLRKVVARAYPQARVEEVVYLDRTGSRPTEAVHFTLELELA